jgi:hypothetical protein
MRSLVFMLVLVLTAVVIHLSIYNDKLDFMCSETKCIGNIHLPLKQLLNIEADCIRVSTEEQCSILAFLHARNIIIRDPRHRSIIHIIFREASAFPARYVELYKRLARMVSKTSDGLNQIPWYVMSFDQFIWRYAQWRDPATSYIFHRDDPAVARKDNVLLQRVHDGLGYMHAPIMLQHYMKCRDTNSSCLHQVLDVTRYILGSFTPANLKRNILKERASISSKEFLGRILNPGTLLNNANVESIHREFLQNHGPVLLPQFAVRSDFCTGGQHVHTGPATGGYTGLHAMLLIGVRVEGDTRRFLLQNWWRHCQFVEVDLEYLESCIYSKYSSATIVTTPQSSVPVGFAQKAWLYAETANLDRAELILEK